MANKKPADDEIPPALKLLHKIWPPAPEPLGKTIGKALRGNKDAKEAFTDRAADTLGKARDVVDNAADMGSTIRQKYAANRKKPNP